MKKIFLGLLSLVTLACNTVSKKEYQDPQNLWGDLYAEVENAQLYPNIKEFWDAAPVSNAKNVMQYYEQDKKNGTFELKKFIAENFKVPNYSQAYTSSKLPFDQYVEAEYEKLLTKPKDDGGTLIPPRMKYVVGGGMFNEYNYFTSFFNIKAYQQLQNDSLAANLATNCFQFIQDYGYVPYGNRSYYLGYTGLPMLSFMAQAVGEKTPKLLPWFGNLMARDYQVWMASETDEDKKEIQKQRNYKTVVFLEGEKTLNRYYNDKAENPFISLLKATYWENTSRFDGQSPSSFIPVDLNASLYLLETMLAESFEAKGRKDYAESYRSLANIRKDLMNKYLYNANSGYFFDYNYQSKKPSEAKTLAAIYPILAGMTSLEQNQKIIAFVEQNLKTANGVINAADQPLGSAEMNYLMILAYRKVGMQDKAEQLRQAWLNVNQSYFAAHQHILPTYNLKDPLTSPKTPQRIDGALAVLNILLNEK